MGDLERIKTEKCGRLQRGLTTDWATVHSVINRCLDAGLERLGAKPQRFLDELCKLGNAERIDAPMPLYRAV